MDLAANRSLILRILDGFALAQISQHHHHQRGWFVGSFQMLGQSHQIPIHIIPILHDLS